MMEPHMVKGTAALTVGREGGKWADTTDLEVLGLVVETRPHNLSEVSSLDLGRVAELGSGGGSVP